MRTLPNNQTITATRTKPKLIPPLTGRGKIMSPVGARHPKTDAASTRRGFKVSKQFLCCRFKIDVLDKLYPSICHRHLAPWYAKGKDKKYAIASSAPSKPCRLLSSRSSINRNVRTMMLLLLLRTGRQWKCLFKRR